MKKLSIIILIFLCIASFGESLRGRVFWVKDGDTVVLNLRDGRWFTVRLYGIDAPEAEQEYGREATLALIGLIGRRNVTVEVVSTDRYNRKVGRIIYRKQNINLEMIKSGAAWHYAAYAPDNEQFALAQKAAREARIGLWKSESPVPPWIWRKQKKQERSADKKY